MRILLVEDDSSTAKSIEMMLKSEGYVVDLADMGEDYIAGMTRAIPAGKLGTPEDIGHLAAFLASREAGYITGQAIAVDGGQVLPESPDAVSP